MVLTMNEVRYIDPAYSPITASATPTLLAAHLTGAVGGRPWSGGGLVWQRNQLTCLKALLDNRDSGFCRNGIIFNAAEVEEAIEWLAEKLRTNSFVYGRAIPATEKTYQLSRI